MPSLLVVQGNDRGKRFELRDASMALGRDPANPIQIHDSEVSRRHAEIRHAEGAPFRVVDLGSANGTFLNGQPILEAQLRTGDRLQVGQSVLVFTESPLPLPDLTARVDLLGTTSPPERSAIVRSVAAADASRLLSDPAAAGDWLRSRLAQLGVLYQTTQAVSHILDPAELLPRILELIFETIGADRGAILLANPEGQLTPRAVHYRDPTHPDQRLAISQTIVDRVFTTGEGVITTDAPSDERFRQAESIVDYSIREALCVPIQGRHMNLGVLYADARGDLAALSPQSESHQTRFTNEHLMLAAAIAHQAGLAIENTEFYQAKLQSERLAAVGQTIATLSHHIKNILQGLKSGSYLIDLGLQNQDHDTIRRGWSILERNQSRIFNLVMDMLSYSKDRQPALESCDLNQLVAEVVELVQARAAETNITIAQSLAPNLPQVLVDEDGIHRATLNLLANALDACEGQPSPHIHVSTHWDEASSTASICIQDNGVGIAPDELAHVFQLFTSSKGTRGTGLGLAVSQKIVREHGGEIRVESELGRGTSFTIELPQRRGDSANLPEIPADQAPFLGSP